MPSTTRLGSDGGNATAGNAGRSDPPAEDTAGSPLPTAATYLVPVAMGVWTWLVVLLAGGVVLSMNSPSLLSVLLLAGLGLLFVPLYRFRPWQAGLTGRVLAFARRRRTTLAVTAGLVALVRLPVVSDVLSPVLGLLLFPLRVVPQVLYSVSVFYGARLGPSVGQLLFEVGRLYAELLWLYTVATVAVSLVPTGGDRQ